MRLVCIARVDHAFELRRREETVSNEGLRQNGAVARHGRRHRGHGGGLHKCCRMLRRAVDPDRLQVIDLVDRVLQRAIGFAPGFWQVVERGRLDVVERMLRAFLGERTGFFACCVAQGVEVGAGRLRRDRKGRCGGAGRGAAAFRAMGEYYGEKITRGRADRMIGGVNISRCGLFSTSRALIDYRQPRVDRGAMPCEDLAVDGGRKHDIGALADPLKCRLEGFQRGTEAFAGDDDKPPTRREACQGGKHMLTGRLPKPALDMVGSGKRRVHHHDRGRDRAIKTIVDRGSIVVRYGGIGEQLPQ